MRMLLATMTTSFHDSISLLKSRAGPSFSKKTALVAVPASMQLGGKLSGVKWPAQTPDLNPIAHLRRLLERCIATRRPPLTKPTAVDNGLA